MKLLIWSVFALLALLWTGSVLVGIELTAWLTSAMASGQATDAATSIGQWPAPAWISLWIDPAWVQALQATWTQVMGWMGHGGPVLGYVLGWLIPLAWIAWGLVMLLMLAATAALHLLLRQFHRPLVPGQVQA